MASILLTMLAITACNQKDPVTDGPTKHDWDKPADHTLLMYLVGDNTLSSYLETNVRQAQYAMLDSVEACNVNVVVMKDTRQCKPMLFWVHRNKDAKLDTVMIKQWDTEMNTASPDFLAEVIDLTFSRFNTKIKGLALGSHASGWAPMTNDNPYNAPQRRAFGHDDESKPVGSIELWDLAAAIAKGPKLDYILMDCCHMAGAEVAYEMRNVADYMVACPSEEEGSGLPYRKAVPALSQCATSADLPKTLSYCAKCYFDSFAKMEGATISVIDLRQMQSLANAYQRLIAANKDILDYYSQANGYEIDEWLSDFKHYGRELSNLYYRYYFHDMGMVIDWMGMRDAAAAKDAKDALQKVVLYNYQTDVYRSLNIAGGCGLTVTLPEVLHLAKWGNPYRAHFTPFDDKKLIRGYQLTAWGSAMGY